MTPCVTVAGTARDSDRPLTPRSVSPWPGADINTQASDNASALYEACKNEHEDVVEFLLSQGADANKANKDGMLPLHIASKKGNYRSARALPPCSVAPRCWSGGCKCPAHGTREAQEGSGWRAPSR